MSRNVTGCRPEWGLIGAHRALPPSLQGEPGPGAACRPPGCTSGLIWGYRDAGEPSPDSRPSVLVSVTAEVTATFPLRALEAPSPLHLLPRRPRWLPAQRAEPVTEDWIVKALLRENPVTGSRPLALQTAPAAPPARACGGAGQLAPPALCRPVPLWTLDITLGQWGAMEAPQAEMQEHV